MSRIVKEYKIKEPTIELLAIELFNQDGQYGASWMQISEETRNKYRNMAAGNKPIQQKRLDTRDDSY